MHCLVSLSRTPITTGAQQPHTKHGRTLSATHREQATRLTKVARSTSDQVCAVNSRSYCADLPTLVLSAKRHTPERHDGFQCMCLVTPVHVNIKHILSTPYTPTTNTGCVNAQQRRHQW